MNVKVQTDVFQSSLLQAIMKELPVYDGSISSGGRISYASQEPWLFVGTVRENILFGQPYIPEKYQEVVRVCALQKDFDMFRHGDKTLVGEKGISLSGGQRARINLARYVRKQKLLLLLLLLLLSNFSLLSFGWEIFAYPGM